MCRIMTFNLSGGDKRHSYRRIGNYLADACADVVMLQELDTRAASRDTERDIRDICAGRVFTLAPSPVTETEHGWFGNAVLSRFPVVSNDTININPDNTTPAIIQVVVIATPHGEVTLINAHKTAKRQIPLLKEYISQHLAHNTMPMILGGDFSERQMFYSAFKLLDDVLVPHTVGTTFPFRFPLFSLDRVWTSGDIRLRRSKRLSDNKVKTFSSHRPVQLDVQLPASAA